MFRAFFYSVNTQGSTDHALPVTGNGTDPLQRVIVTEDPTNKVIARTHCVQPSSGLTYLIRWSRRKFKRLRHQTKDARGIFGERRS